MIKILLAAVILLVGIGCSIDSVFLEGEKQTWDAIAPEYKKFVIDREPVPEWSEAEKAARQETLDRWKKNLDDADD